MAQFYITHTDADGEKHQLTGAWDAKTPNEAVAMMLTQAGGDDDGRWEAHVVTSPDDVFQ